MAKEVGVDRVGVEVEACGNILDVDDETSSAI